MIKLLPEHADIFMITSLDGKFEFVNDKSEVLASL